MEEQQERRNVGEIELEGGQPSRDSGQTGLDSEEHRIDINEISPRVKNWIGSVKEAEERTKSQTQWPRIPKVPQMLRGTPDFKKFYEPRVISIGPYHHGKPHLQSVEMMKPLCAKKFLADSNQYIEALYTKIKSDIEALRKCYDKIPTEKYDDEELAWMMLLDGCFLLQFIRWKGKINVLKVHEINFVVQDLFLLENQLPYGVLKLIFERANFKVGLPMEKNIIEFVTQIGMPEGLSSEIQLKEVNEEPSHLLDLLRSALLGRFKMIRGSQPEQEQEAEKKGESSSSSGGGNGGSQPEQEQEAEKKGESSSSSGGGNGGSQPEQEQEAEKKGESSSSSGGGNGGSQPEQEQEPKKRVESSSSLGGDWSRQPEQEQQAEENGKSSSGGGDGGFCCLCKNGKKRGIWQSFRHIKELKAAGIYLKPSRTCFLTDISFKSYFFFGNLKLPPITIDDSTKTKFLNMVAYEMCPDGPDDYAVTSYVCFLDDLIDHADDVKELRSKHILHNLLGSDEDVAQIFNEIGNGLVDPDIYEDVKALIQKHYDERANTWIAEALHGHFRSPWTFMALIAAVLILILTGVQTYYAHRGDYIIYIYASSIVIGLCFFLVRHFCD